MDNNQPAGSEHKAASQEMAKAKLRKWRVISIVFGVIPPIGYIILNIAINILNVSSGGFGWAYLMLLAPVVLIGFGVCLAMTIISFVRMIVCSRKSGGKMRTWDFVIAIAMIIFVFSPFLISKIWVSTLKSIKISDPYYWSGEGGLSCDFNDRRKVLDADYYTEVIGCMVVDYYGVHKKYPEESYAQLFLSRKYPEFGRDGYRLVINTEDKPNWTDFVIQYGVNCKGEAKSSYDGEDFSNGFAVYSPLYSASYGDDLRFCIDFNPN